jgi:hypothetical protein
MKIISSIRQNLFRKIRNLSLQCRKPFQPCHCNMICRELQSELALRWTITERREFILLHIKTISNIRTCQHDNQLTFTPHLLRCRDNEHVFIFEQSICGVNHEDFQQHHHCIFAPTIISTT